MSLRPRLLLPRLAIVAAAGVVLGLVVLGQAGAPASTGGPQATPGARAVPTTAAVPSTPASAIPGQTPSASFAPSVTPAPTPTGTRSSGHQPPPATPNVVVLLLDDVPYLDDASPWQATPQIAATFLQHGTTFSDFHGETPLCCPGRAGFLTGLHTYHHHVTWNNAALFNPQMSLATALHDRGYYTFLVGKYLNFYDRIAPAVPPGWDGFHATAGSPMYFDYDIWNNGDPTPQHFGNLPDLYSTDVLTQKTVREIKGAPADQPIFAWIGLNAAHGPMVPAPRYANAACSQMPAWTAPNVAEADVSDKPAYIRKLPIGPTSIDLTRLCRMLMSVDDSFVAIRNELVADGRWDNTLFVITSDNGMGYGAHRVGLEKRAPYTTQLPFLVSWPAGIGTQPRSIDARLQNIDFAPTICELAGCTLGPFPGGPAKPDGLSFASLLLGTGRAPVRDAVLSGFAEHGTPIPYWNAVTTTGDSPLARQGCALAASGGCIWHYVRYETGEKELYDDANGPCWSWSIGQPGDPCELKNLAGEPQFASIQAALDARLDQLLSVPPT